MYYNKDDYSIYYEKYGKSEKTILILPGWGNTRKTFDYIQIDLQIGARTYKHIENLGESELINLVKQNDIVYGSGDTGQTAQTKYFNCKEANIGEYTKLVNYMKFVEI